jgi:hypothetical protein
MSTPKLKITGVALIFTSRAWSALCAFMPKRSAWS